MCYNITNVMSILGFIHQYRNINNVFKWSFLYDSSHILIAYIIIKSLDKKIAYKEISSVAFWE